MRLARLSLAVLATLMLVLGASVPVAHAQGVPGVDANKCLAGKNKCVAKKIAGLLQCRAKCQKSPTKCDYAPGVGPQTSCETKVMAKFDGGATPTKGCFEKLEAHDVLGASPDKVCTTSNDTGSMEAQVDAAVGDLVATLEGNPPPTCGDGVANGAESCDAPDLGGATCVSLGFASGTLGCTAGCGYDTSACASQAFLATGQTTCSNTAGAVVACAGTGQDGAVQAGAVLAYTDNGDGTVTDDNTGLTWEKKSDDGTIHDKDTTYTWADAFAVHVAGLNTAVFAGHADWRLPNVKELHSIVNFENSYPPVSFAFNTSCAPACTVTSCSCTQSSAYYWTATSFAGNPILAFIVNFGDGFMVLDGKANARPVRAVRGGL